MPKILQEMIVSIVSSQARFHIVGKLSAGSDLLSAIRQTGPEVVITRETIMPQDRGEDARRLDAQYSVKVVAINETGREAALYNLNFHHTPLGEVSASSLISTIDRAAGRS
ncbi:DNA-binding NarL/FixJ family response regulator [Bradyrhizobium diazoefficiens]